MAVARNSRLTGTSPGALAAVREALERPGSYGSLPPEDTLVAELWVRGFKVVPLEASDGVA